MKLTTKQIDSIIAVINKAVENYDEQAEELFEEWDSIEQDAHYENRSNTKEEQDRAEELEEITNRLEELKSEALAVLDMISAEYRNGNR